MKRNDVLAAVARMLRSRAATAAKCARPPFGTPEIAEEKRLSLEHAAEELEYLLTLPGREANDKLREWAQRWQP